MSEGRERWERWAALRGRRLADMLASARPEAQAASCRLRPRASLPRRAAPRRAHPCNPAAASPYSMWWELVLEARSLMPFTSLELRMDDEPTKLDLAKPLEGDNIAWRPNAMHQQVGWALALVAGACPASCWGTAGAGQARELAGGLGWDRARPAAGGALCNHLPPRPSTPQDISVTPRSAYWAPYMGAPNSNNDLISAADAIRTLTWTLNKASGEGANRRLVLDQFRCGCRGWRGGCLLGGCKCCCWPLAAHCPAGGTGSRAAPQRCAACRRFIESNPQGQHHSKLDPDELPAFLDQAAEVLRNLSVGYGLWAYRAYRRNELHNGAFQQRLEGWGVDGCCGWPVDTDAENVSGLISLLARCCKWCLPALRRAWHGRAPCSLGR